MKRKGKVFTICVEEELEKLGNKERKANDRVLKWSRT